MNARHRVALAVAALLFFASHVRTLPRTLEDLDSINFALGVEQYDVTRHRPHPPGYPVYVAVAKASTAIVRDAAPQLGRDRIAAAGLGAIGLIAGTVAPFVFAGFWTAAGFSPITAILAALLAVCSPLFWFTASRPLSDTVGLVAAAAVQTVLVRAIVRLRGDARAPVPMSTWIAALSAGLLIGVRSQTIWLTGPLLVWLVALLVRGRRTKDGAALVVAAAAGAMMWALPTVWLTGGIGPYVSAVTGQGAADIRDIELLATHRTAAMLRVALARTLLWPWAKDVPLLGNLLAVFALVGLMRSFVRARFRLAIIGAAFVPYLLFHLLFHETLTLRYALPMVVPIAGLAVTALSGLPVAVVSGVVGALAVTGVLIAQPRLRTYAADGDPFFRGFERMVAELPGRPVAPVLRTQHQVWWAVQRVIDWYRPYWDVGPQPHPGDHEWLTLEQDWNNGSKRPVWFLTDVSRTDESLFDPRSLTYKGRYEPQSGVRNLILGARLDRYDWWEIQPPRWMLGRGWALTPEVAGVSSADRTGPHLGGADGFVRREGDSGPTRLMVGGRYLSGTSPAVMIATLDNRQIAAWRVSSNPNWFVQWIDLPQGVAPSSSPYAPLRITAASESVDDPTPAIQLEQFDAAPVEEPVYAFADGWQEPEENEAMGTLWRWTSNRSVLDIRGGRGDLVLRIAGESPLRYFPHAPVVTVRAGERELARFSPSADFTQDVTVPADALAAAAGHVIIDTTLTFVPAERGQSADRRVLGLRISDVWVRNK